MLVYEYNMLFGRACGAQAASPPSEVFLENSFRSRRVRRHLTYRRRRVVTEIWNIIDVNSKEILRP